MGNKPQSRALTCAFLRPGAPTPAEWPLPHAPVGHPAVVLPVDGLNVLFGRSAPRVVSLALRQALQQGYRPVAVGLELALPRALPGPVDLADLAAVSTLILDKTRVTVALATAIEDRLAAYWRPEGRAPGLRRAAILFDGVGAHPGPGTRVCPPARHRLHGAGRRRGADLRVAVSAGSDRHHPDRRAAGRGRADHLSPADPGRTGDTRGRLQSVPGRGKRLNDAPARPPEPSIIPHQGAPRGADRPIPASNRFNDRTINR